MEDTENRGTCEAFHCFAPFGGEAYVWKRDSMRCLFLGKGKCSAEQPFQNSKFPRQLSTIPLGYLPRSSFAREFEVRGV